MNVDVGSESRMVEGFRRSIEEVLSGSSDGLFNAAVELTDLSIAQACEVLYRMAAERGVQEAWLNLAYVVADDGRDAEARELIRMSAEAGDPKGAFMYAQDLEEARDLHGAERWYEQAGEIPGAQARRARVLRSLDREGESLALLRTASAGDAEAAIDLIDIDPDLEPGSAISLLETHRGNGSLDVLIPLSILYERKGDDAAAIEVLKESVDHGEPNAYFNLGLILARNGDMTEAEKLIRRAAESGDVMAIRWMRESGLAR